MDKNCGKIFRIHKILQLMNIIGNERIWTNICFHNVWVKKEKKKNSNLDYLILVNPQTKKFFL